MNEAMLIAAVIGAVLGTIHAIGVYGDRLRNAQNEGHSNALSHARAYYYALWTLLLWLVFGAYVFIAWVIASILYLPAWLANTLRPSDPDERGGA